MANPVKAVPECSPTITPSLTCKGAARAIDFYKQVFGAKPRRGKNPRRPVMANPVKAVPECSPTITPSLTCKGAARAIDFYKQVFGAKESMRMEGPGGSIGHAELTIGNSKIMVNDEFPGRAVAPAGCTSHYLYVYFADCDAVFNRAVAAGAKVTMPLADQFWGDRYGAITDPFGHNWGIASHMEDVAPEEMDRRAKEFMAKMSGHAASAG